MTSYVVLSHEGRSDEKSGEKTIFMRDAFSFVALAVPILWLLWYRLWFHAAMVALATIPIFMLVQSPIFIVAAFPLNLLLGIFVALEGPAWRIGQLKHQDYVECGTVEAQSLGDAQIIWSLQEDGDSPMQPPLPKPASAAPIVNDLIFGGAR